MPFNFSFNGASLHAIGITQKKEKQVFGFYCYAELQLRENAKSLKRTRRYGRGHSFPISNTGCVPDPLERYSKFLKLGTAHLAN
jgi:hypothetical protein